MMTDLMVLPSELQAPVDDGACRHLEGMALPDIRLSNHSGQSVNLPLLPGSSIVDLL
ncbi:MAG: hypothetical protein HUJ23_00670 [Methylophaga sp.]|nr:hypothetical protein [Methylophaga sp.]